MKNFLRNPLALVRGFLELDNIHTSLLQIAIYLPKGGIDFEELRAYHLVSVIDRGMNLQRSH